MTPPPSFSTMFSLCFYLGASYLQGEHLPLSHLPGHSPTAQSHCPCSPVAPMDDLGTLKEQHREQKLFPQLLQLLCNREPKSLEGHQGHQATPSSTLRPKETGVKPSETVLQGRDRRPSRAHWTMLRPPLLPSSRQGSWVHLFLLDHAKASLLWGPGSLQNTPRTHPFLQHREGG